MKFTYKSPKELEDLSEYQLEKYLDEKAKFEAEQAKENAETAAKAIAEQLIADAKKSQEEAIEAVKEEAKKALEAKDEELKGKIEALEAKLQRTNFGDRAERIKTMSDLIEAKFSTTEGEQLLKDFAKGAKGAFNTDMEASKVLLKPTGNGGYVAPEMAGIFGVGHDMLHARDVLRVLPTAADVIKFLRLTPNPDADGIGLVEEGQTKPDMGYLSEVVSVEVEKIAGLLDISDEMLDDIVGLRAFLAAELPLALYEFEDQYIFKSTNGIYTLAEQWVPNGNVTAESNAWDILVSARTQVSLNKRRATAAFVSPILYQELLINKSDENAYTYPIIIDANGVLRVGTLPIYETNIMEGGEFVVGDFATGAAFWQRKAVNIRYSDEHKDNFAKNIVSVRIEERGAITVYKTDAFVKGDIGYPTTT